MEVCFFPRKDYDVEVCNHRLGKDMTYTEDTDGIRGALNWILPLAESKGIKYSAFLYNKDSALNIPSVISEYINNNKLWVDSYFYTPQSPGGTITQSIYEEYRDLYLDLFNRLFGIRPIAISYAYGNISCSEYAKSDFLVGRNSGRTLDTDYGVGLGSPNNTPYSLERFISKPSTTRWYNDVVDNIASPTLSDFKQRLTTLSTQIDITLANGGWFNNFTHIADVYNAGEVHQGAYEEYLNLLVSKNYDNRIYFAGYGEAVAYLAFRQMITKAVMYSPNSNPQNELIIRLETDNTSLQVNTDLLKVPISVKFSTIGTPLEERSIKSDRNLISLGNN